MSSSRVQTPPRWSCTWVTARVACLTAGRGHRILRADLPDHPGTFLVLRELRAPGPGAGRLFGHLAGGLGGHPVGVVVTLDPPRCERLADRRTLCSSGNSGPAGCQRSGVHRRIRGRRLNLVLRLAAVPPRHTREHAMGASGGACAGRREHRQNAGDPYFLVLPSCSTVQVTCS